jgi:hypothetical protein
MYPGAMVVAIGSIWTLGWATSAAGRTDAMCGPVITRDDATAVTETHPRPADQAVQQGDDADDCDGETE